MQSQPTGRYEKLHRVRSSQKKFQLRVVFDCLSNCVEGVFLVIFVEETEQTPHTRSRAVVILRFDIYRSFLDLGASA